MNAIEEGFISDPPRSKQEAAENMAWGAITSLKSMASGTASGTRIIPAAIPVRTILTKFIIRMKTMVHISASAPAGLIASWIETPGR